MLDLIHRMNTDCHLPVLPIIAVTVPGLHEKLTRSIAGVPLGQRTDKFYHQSVKSVISYEIKLPTLAIIDGSTGLFTGINGGSGSSATSGRLIKFYRKSKQ